MKPDHARAAQEIAAGNPGWQFFVDNRALWKVDGERIGASVVYRQGAWVACDEEGRYQMQGIHAREFASPRAAVEALGFTLED